MAAVTLRLPHRTLFQLSGEHEARPLIWLYRTKWGGRWQRPWWAGDPPHHHLYTTTRPPKSLSQRSNSANRSYKITKRFTYSQAFITKRKSHVHTLVILQRIVSDLRLVKWTLGYIITARGWIGTLWPPSHYIAALLMSQCVYIR